MTAPDRYPSSRREARVFGAREGQPIALPLARHVRRRRAAGIRAGFALTASAALVVGGASAVTAAITGGPVAGSEPTVVAAEPPQLRPLIDATVLPLPAEGLPSPTLQVVAVGTALCDEPTLLDALANGTDAAVIAAAGGAAAFRTAVATGGAPCIPLDDPTRAWAVVNKQRPYAPVDYAPTPIALPDGVRSLSGGELRADAAESLTALVRAASDAGVGELAMESGYRSYTTQQATYGGHVGDRGVEGADLVSARPGFSEHQSGLGADMVACDGSCGTIDDLAATPQGAWLADHAWEHGWIVRYVEGHTDVTGYLPEPWHIRYIGPELAAEYEAGGWSTLEEFFGQAAAADYAG